MSFQFNGGAALATVNRQQVLRLCDGHLAEARSAFRTLLADITKNFISEFNFQLTTGDGPGLADGISFCIQTLGLTAVGSGSGNLAVPATQSVAIGFNTFATSGNTTGFVTGGSVPAPLPDNVSPILFSNQNVIYVRVEYDVAAHVIRWRMIDLTTFATFEDSAAVNLATTLGASTAYVGFTGATGGYGSVQTISYWRWSGAESFIELPINAAQEGAVPTNINLSGTNPAPPIGFDNALPQGSDLYPDPTLPVFFVRDNSFAVAKPVDFWAESATASLQSRATLTVIKAIAGSGGITLTLPPAGSVPGKRFSISKTDSAAGAVTVAGYSSELIGAANTRVISLQYGFIGIVSDGVRWLIESDASDSGLFATKVGVQRQSHIYATDTGAANAYVVALSPVLTSYVAGQVVAFKAANANTTAVTLNAGGGAIAIKKNSAGTLVDLVSGDIAANIIYVVQYDGTVWQMASGGGGGGAVTFSGDLSGTTGGPQTVIGIQGKQVNGAPSVDGVLAQYSTASGKIEWLPRPLFPVSAFGGVPPWGLNVCIYTAPVAVTFPANFATPNSYGSVGANPTATATYNVYKKSVGGSPTLIGTVAISTSGVFTFATIGGVGFSLNAGDRLTIVAPSSSDATLSDVGITLVGQMGAFVSPALTNPVVAWKAAYNNGTTYSTYDIVSYQGGVYIAILGGVGHVPTNATYWNLLMGYGLNQRGDYNGATAYVPYDLVQYGTPKSTYICILATTGNLPTNTTYWSVFAGAGSTTGDALKADIQVQAYTAADDTGAANAYAVAITPSISSYVAYLRISWKALHTNTGASTIAVSGLSTKNIKKWSGGSKVALIAGDITIGQYMDTEYDGTDFILLGAGGGDTTAQYFIGAADAALPNAIVWPALASHPDIPPASANAMDDEFDAGSLSGIWTTYNPSSLTPTAGFASSYGSWAFGTVANRVWALTQAVPAGNWKFRAKLALEGFAGNYFGWGMFLRRSSVDKNMNFAIMFHASHANGPMSIIINTTGATYTSETDLFNIACSVLYMELEYDGTNLIWRASSSGYKFVRAYQATPAASFLGGAPSDIGVGAHPYNNTADANMSTTGSIDFFRRIS